MTSLRTCDVVTIPSGVRALRDRASGEIMHCGTGPGVEPGALYVEPSRLEARLGEDSAAALGPLVLFDVGLGAASNALAAWHVSERSPAGARRLEIVSFDHDLSALELALEDENASAFGLSSAEPAARDAALAIVQRGCHETARTSWRLARGEFQTALAREPVGSADVVFWDLYSPRTSPELWTVAGFRALRRACREGATLHTYSAATAARSALLLAGFAVGLGACTGDRANTTMAATRVADLEQPLAERWLTRLGRSSAAFPPDVVDPAAALAAIREHVQFAHITASRR